MTPHLGHAHGVVRHTRSSHQRTGCSVIGAPSRRHAGRPGSPPACAESRRSPDTGSGRGPLRQCRQASQAPETSRAPPRLAGRKSPGHARPAAQFPTTRRETEFARGRAAYREGGDLSSGASWEERRQAGSENNRPGSACRTSAANAPPARSRGGSSRQFAVGQGDGEVDTRQVRDGFE